MTYTHTHTHATFTIHNMHTYMYAHIYKKVIHAIAGGQV